MEKLLKRSTFAVPYKLRFEGEQLEELAIPIDSRFVIEGWSYDSIKELLQLTILYPAAYSFWDKWLIRQEWVVKSST